MDFTEVDHKMYLSSTKCRLLDFTDADYRVMNSVSDTDVLDILKMNISVEHSWMNFTTILH